MVLLYSIIQSVEMLATKININSTTNNNSETGDQIYQLSNDKIGLAILPIFDDKTDSFTRQKISITKESSSENGANEGKVGFTRNAETNDIEQITTPIEITLPRTLIEDANRGHSATTKRKTVQFVYFNDDSLFPVMSPRRNDSPVENATISKIVSGVFSLKVIPTIPSTKTKHLIS